MQESKNSVWQSHLGSGESILFEFGVGDRFIKVALISWVLIGIITLPIYLGFVILPAVLFYCLFYIKRAYKYALTNKRIMAKIGWLSTSMLTVEYSKITDILVKQNLGDRLFYKTGEIQINTAGGHGKELTLKYVENPYDLKNRIFEISSTGVNQIKVNTDYTEELFKLSKLKNEGVITEQEFEQKKTKILNI